MFWKKLVEVQNHFNINIFLDWIYVFCLRPILRKVFVVMVSLTETYLWFIDYLVEEKYRVVCYGSCLGNYNASSFRFEQICHSDLLNAEVHLKPNLIHIRLQSDFFEFIILHHSVILL